ncbi:TonB-dependent receptor [Zhouia spongiae]|uniref:TonB-dependent receptor n=1 Tax=Zhouia spongiae TaxID=2202721 RepID=A0ABY3YH92_9FLAO|nr:TonB-dependent receptor [Zhouia spongiae]UNY97305.1 TonB-dependent receptor [Zhouia spongiae]
MKRFLFMMVAFFLVGYSYAQEKTITGQVTDSETGMPIPGVNVLVKNTTNGVATDFDGNYSIEVSASATLIFSYVGYQTAEKPVGGNTSINVALAIEASQLDEVVVVGYGTQKKENLTGSVSSIKTDEIEGRATTSLTNALQGLTPGVTVVSQAGNVGSDMGSINVRGRGNLGSSSPLYIVDGIPVNARDFQRINPSDVESISVLKDAAAASIYGSRAAYGVFIVTTKKGKEGKASFSYNTYFGWQSPTVLPKKVNGVQYANLINEANVNAGKSAVYSNDELQTIKDQSNPDLYPDNDWYDLFYRSSAPMLEHNISVSGGGDTRYFVSGTFFEQNSLVPGTSLDRYSIRANTERDFGDNFTLGTNISFVQEDIERKGDFSFVDLDRMTPLTVGRHSDGTWGSITGGKVSSVLAENNPLRKVAEYGWEDRQKSTFIGSINAKLQLTKDISVKGIVSYQTYNEERNTFKNEVDPVINFLTKEPIASTRKTPNSLEVRWDKDHTFMAQAFATYEKEIEKHDVKFMIGTQYEATQYKYLLASRKEFPSNGLGAINGGSNAAINLSNKGLIEEEAFVSQFGRLNYSFDDKYLVEANIRFDQSSKFNSDNRLGVFPSFSAAWRVSQESFLENVEWLSNMKLRGSWGQLGYVDNVGFYDYYDALGTGTAAIIGGGRVDGVWPYRQANPNLGWETVTMTNIGIDVGLFRNALSFQLDAFNKVTDDILLEVPMPLELGLEDNEEVVISQNAGKVTNRGLEIALAYRGEINDFKYSVSGNMSKIWNKIDDLRGNNDQIYESKWIFREGESIGSFYMYEADGLFSTQEEVDAHAFQSSATSPGDIKYKDLNNDGVINGDDRKIVGNDVPYFTYGLSFNASYKGFDFNVQGQGVADVKVYLDAEASQAFYNGAGAKEYHLNRWTPDNPDPNADYPRILPSGESQHNQVLSSFWMYNASYFRIKNLALGYTLPLDVTEKYGLSKLRFYVSGTNLFTTRSDKRLDDFDPEFPSRRAGYPIMKVVSLGLNVNF